LDYSDGAVAATLSSIMILLKSPHQEYNAKMDSFKQWMRAKRLPQSVRMQLTAFYDRRISSQEDIVVNEHEIMESLQPAPISVDLVQVMYASTIARVPIFQSMDEEVIAALCLCLRMIPALEGSPVILQGRVGEEMYVVNSGRLQVWENDAQAPTRVKCRHAGVTFWAQVYDSDHGGGTIDLHGKGDSEFLQHRALSMHDQAKLQAVVLHVEKEEDFSADFDVAFGRKNTDAFKILKERMAVEALEVRQGSVLGYISSGDYFGESSLIATDAEHPNFRYDRTVTAMTDCDLCYLQRKDMPELMAKYPALEEQLKGFVLMRLRAERSRRLFNEIDRDHSGHLCSDEMNQLLRSLGIEEKSERTQAIEEMDIEGGTTAKPYTLYTLVFASRYLATYDRAGANWLQPATDTGVLDGIVREIVA